MIYLINTKVRRLIRGLSCEVEKHHIFLYPPKQRHLEGSQEAAGFHKSINCPPTITYLSKY